MPDIDIKTIRYVEPDQFQAILDAIEDNTGRFRRKMDEFKPWLPLALRTYRATGARPAEIVGKSARVRREPEEGYAAQSGIQEHHGLRAMDLKGDYAALLEGKSTMAGRQRAQGLKPRMVTVADGDVYRELHDLAETVRPDAHIMGLGPSPRQHGDGYWQLTRQVRKLRPFLPMEIQDFEVRWLRHSWAIYALRNGVDIYEVARQLGHGSPEMPDIKTTAIYLRFAPVSRERVVKAFTPRPVEVAAPPPKKHDCPGCGFAWHEDQHGRPMLEGRMGLALMRRKLRQ